MTAHLLSDANGDRARCVINGGDARGILPLELRGGSSLSLSTWITRCIILCNIHNNA